MQHKIAVRPDVD